jgi:hypothetical protein
VRFHPGRRLTRGDVAEVVALVARRVTRVVERRGLAGRAEDGEASDPWSDEAPVLAAVAAASVDGRVHSGRERARASGDAATTLKTSRRRFWDPVTPTPMGSIGTPGWWSEPANGIGWSECVAMRCGLPWLRSDCTRPVTARSG